MKIPPAPHSWALAPRQAVAVQRRLAGSVRVETPARELRLVAGLDAAFSRNGERCIAGVVLWDRRERVVLEQRLAERRPNMPYVPGLLSFREAPALIAALRKLERSPDVLLCDGHGIAHPRRFGIACHLGVILDRPALGCAKSRLVGTHGEVGVARGSRRALKDGAERLGTLLRTRTGVKPVYVSVGHRIDLASAERLVLDCSLGYRLPEPTRLADRLVAAAKGPRGVPRGKSGG